MVTKNENENGDDKDGDEVMIMKDIKKGQPHTKCSNI